MERRIHDRLTGIPTQSSFTQFAGAARQQCREAGKRFTILFIDLNGMKYFNGLFGYEEGDRLLQTVALLFGEHFGPGCICRLGQDHFAAFSDKDEIDAILNRLFDDALKLNEGRTLPIHVGVYRDVPDSISIPTACDRAKIACDLLRSTYVSGFNYFSDELLSAAADRRYILNNLDRALEEKWVKVFYQPIVRSANGCICDEEALCRWVDPERGLLSPVTFIPALEDTRLIYKLDLYMVDQVLKDIRRKEQRGLFIVPVSVNISRADFETCDIVSEIDQRVTKAGVRKEFINIEITESAVANDMLYMKEQIDRFRSLGFRVWMDDFGSGYSSLDLLQCFDFDLIKFDMTFLRQLHSSKKSRIILSQLMKMVQKLGVDTVVEGVEEEEHLRYLRGIGCDKLQGMYFHPPVPLDVIIALQENPGTLQFEDPRESDYYCAVGTANISDPVFLEGKTSESFRPFLQSVPVAILELYQDKVSLLRCNAAYAEFMQVSHPAELPELDLCDVIMPEPQNSQFIDALHRCREVDSWFSFAPPEENGLALHAMLRRIAVNPVTNALAAEIVLIPGVS